MKTGICKLCLKQTKLLKQSHIIPNCLYRGLFDQGNKMKLTKKASSKVLPIQTGIFDSNILCANCDNRILGRLDAYASKFMSGGNLQVKVRPSNGPHNNPTFIFNNIDYKTFKLFILSVLWRAHVSVHPFFSKIKLRGQEEFLRQMIMMDICPGEKTFMVSLFAIEEGAKKLLPLIATPRYCEAPNYSFCSFLINGMMYNINLQTEDYPPSLGMFLKESGEIEIPIIMQPFTKDFIDAYLNTEDAILISKP